MINFLHTYSPQPVIFSFGPLKVHWYGLFIVLAIISSFFIVKQLIKNIKIKNKEKHFWNLTFYLIIFGLIGARIYHVISEFGYYRYHFFDIFKIWQGGFGIYGGVLAGIITIYFYSKKSKLSFLFVLDIFSLIVLFGEAFMRWGNYFNQEIFGRPTNLPWGIPINIENRPLQYLNFEYFHPTFLYQFIWNIFLFLVLLFLFVKFSKKNNPLKYSGLIFSFYLIFYNLGRFFIEFLRIDSPRLFFGLHLNQIFAILFFIFGLLFVCLKNKLKFYMASELDVKLKI